MITTYENYITLLTVYIYGKEKANLFESALYTPTKELKDSIKTLMCKHPLLCDILDKELKIDNAFKYLTQYIHNKKFSEEKFYEANQANFELNEEEKETIIQILINISNENNKISIQEKDVGRHIAHHLFNKKEYFQSLIEKQDIINNLLDFSNYNKKVYYQLFSLASLYIILKDYYPKYEEVILNPTEKFYQQLEDLFINVPVLDPIIDKDIVIKESVIILQSCIEKHHMIESKFFHYMKSLKENLESLDKENFLQGILQILSIDGKITQKEEIFYRKLSDIINFNQHTSKKLRHAFIVKKIYSIHWEK
ncbi:MAG: Unknown protein [uncultured Sulfurovum sp.]|uniref:Co-chaperone DjlA N-terminal domain-containing protein n=1 Tax=uncultured Sulfurovum sp. TaxID=269237 RepID=A0A6S6SSY5_9BACT|nr:MAG: Unknown protein [uncultured Sulfurovum sp.]